MQLACCCGGIRRSSGRRGRRRGLSPRIDIDLPGGALLVWRPLLRSAWMISRSPSRLARVSFSCFFRASTFASSSRISESFSGGRRVVGACRTFRFASKSFSRRSRVSGVTRSLNKARKFLLFFWPRILLNSSNPIPFSRARTAKVRRRSESGMSFRPSSCRTCMNLSLSA